jgi:hypothetical protein
MRHEIEASVMVQASPDALWAVISDVTRVGEWSGECRGCVWVEGSGAAVAGAKFRGHNRRGLARWTRVNEVVRAEPPRELVWRTMPGGIYPDSVEWALRLTESGAATRVTESYQVLHIPKWMEILVGVGMPQHKDRTNDLVADLTRLKTLVESNTTPPH